MKYLVIYYVIYTILFTILLLAEIDMYFDKCIDNGWSLSSDYENELSKIVPQKERIKIFLPVCFKYALIPVVRLIIAIELPYAATHER